MNQLLAAALMVGTLTAHAASVPDEMKAVNTDQCLNIGNSAAAKLLDKYAPDDKSKLPKYCQCVSGHYWSGVPQSDYDGMVKEHAAGNVDGPRGKSLSAKSGERLLAAQKACAGS